MKIIKISIILSLIITFSCEKDLKLENEVYCQPNLDNDTIYEIQNKWILAGLLNLDTQREDCVPDNLREMNIIFSDTNRFYGVSSCNTFGGYYEISEHDSIKIYNLWSTLIYCFNDTLSDWELKYYEGLENTVKYKINRDILTLETTSDFNLIFRVD
jgi:heat shock protein HslJ